MSTFNILGSCICRDLFGFQECTNHEVITFQQETSALTWFCYSDKPSKIIDISFYDGIIGLTNFQKRCLVNDYNNTVLETYNKKSDYFITDMTEFASMNIAKENYGNGNQHYFTFSKWFDIAYKNGMKDRFENSIERINQLEIIDDDIIEETMDKYTKWILNMGYSPKQVILIENKRAYMYTDGALLYSFSGDCYRNKLNEVLDKIYDCFKRKMPSAHVIKMPMGVLGDKNHKWGLTDLHFCKGYYDYLYECVDLITINNDSKDLLQELCDKYSKMFIEKKDQYMRNSFSYANGIQLLKGKIASNLAEDYVAPKGINFYEDAFTKKKVGR